MKVPYRGSSMHPTLWRLDVLDVEALDYQDVRVGDVIVFSAMWGCAPDSFVVHRVRRCLPTGLVTQGDDCASADGELVAPQQVVGRVRGVIRKGRWKRIWGGRAGELWLAWVRVRRVGVRATVAAYRSLSGADRLWRWWRPRIARVRVQTPEGVLVKFVCEGRTVGEYRPQQGAFWCRKPYERVLEEARRGSP